MFNGIFFKMSSHSLYIFILICSTIDARSIFSDTINKASSLISNLPCAIPGLCSQNSQVLETTPYPQIPQYHQVPHYPQVPLYPGIPQYYQNYQTNPHQFYTSNQNPHGYNQNLQIPEVPERPGRPLISEEFQVPQEEDSQNAEDSIGPEREQVSEEQQLPVESQKITCPKNGQHYPVYDDCKKYFICVNGYLEVITCPSGLYYNCMTQTCETETLHLCCKNDRNTPESVFTVPNHSYYPCREGAVNGYDPKNIAKCIDDKIYRSSCNNNNEFCMDSLQCFDSSTKSCDENALGEPYQPTDTVLGMELGLEASETCPAGKQNFEIKDNCGAYYNCSSGDPYLYQCPEGYFYDCWNQICSRITSVYCCYEDERYTLPNSGSTDLIDWDSKEYTCKDNMKVAFERPDFKDSYAICSGNLLYFGSCYPNNYCNLTGTCYDPSKERCLSPVVSRFSATTQSLNQMENFWTAKKPSYTTKRPRPYKTRAPKTTTMPTNTAEVEISSPVENELWVPDVYSAEYEASAQALEKQTEKPTFPIHQVPAGTVHMASDQCFEKFSALAVYDDCSKYIIYNNSVATTYSCIGNLKFDGFKKCCVKEHTSFTLACAEDPHKSFVNDISCSDMELQNVEHPTKCNTYFSCDSFGVILEQTCPSGEFFDWQKKGCVNQASAIIVPNCST